jgi:hypothetical protein
MGGMRYLEYCVKEEKTYEILLAIDLDKSILLILILPKY